MTIDIAARAHEQEDARAKALTLDPALTAASTAQASGTAAIVRAARESAGLSVEALGQAAGVSKGKASGWCLGATAPSLTHLVRIAQAAPKCWDAIVRAVARRAPGGHVAGDPTDRLAQLAIEVGHVAMEAQLARADGRWDREEIARERREAQHLRDVADLIDRDLDALAEKLGI